MSGYDFSQVDVHKKSMLDRVGVVGWRSYSMELSALAEALMIRVTQAAISEKYPKYLRFEPSADETRAVIATPVQTESIDTVPVKYSDKARQLSLDLSKFLMVEPLHIPRGKKAYVPITARENGNALIIHFGQAEFKTTRNEKKNQNQSENQSGTGTESAG